VASDQRRMPMTDDLANQFVRACIPTIREHLESAVARARSAEASLASGDLDFAMQIALDIEMPTYEAKVLLDAVSLIRRIGSKA
jgi:hypothetical protein